MLRKIQQNAKKQKKPFYTFPVLVWSLKQSVSILEELLNNLEVKFMWKIKKQKQKQAMNY